MERDDILEELEDMWEESNSIHLGSGEAELDFREAVADWIYRLYNEK